MSELDDIRARRAAANPQTWGTARANMALADIDTLLRMVDALTGERDDLRRSKLYWKSQTSVERDRRDALTAERDALAAQLAQAQRELAAVPVDAMRKMRLDVEVELHGYSNAELDEWLDAEQEAANAASELRAPTYNGGCW